MSHLLSGAGRGHHPASSERCPLADHHPTQPNLAHVRTGASPVYWRVGDPASPLTSVRAQARAARYEAIAIRAAREAWAVWAAGPGPPSG